MITTFVALSMIAGDGVDLSFVAEGAVKKAGGYRPIRAEMAASNDAVKKAPTGATSPQYGQMAFGDKKVLFALDESASPAKIWVDSNRNGDLNDDPVATYTATKRGEYMFHQGSAMIDIGKASPVRVNFYRFDPKEPSRAALKSILLYYGDFGYEVKLDLGGKIYSSFIAGEPDQNLSLWVDRNGDGQQSYNYEMVRAGKPFNYTGTPYVLKVEGGKLSLEKSSESIPIAPQAPELGLGKKALIFEATALDGAKIEFPKSYRGKIVMLDFWATWCGPCIAELPNLTKAYQQYHDQGFEVLGISFDQENMAEKVKTFIVDKNMPWRQIYEGKYWNTTLGMMYDVSGIPFCLLVDGDTGEILGTSKDLRGEAIFKTIPAALAAKKSGR
jgi:thiol-disulfide isomerase/thioredoxin